MRIHICDCFSSYYICVSCDYSSCVYVCVFRAQAWKNEVSSPSETSIRQSIRSLIMWIKAGHNLLTDLCLFLKNRSRENSFACSDTTILSAWPEKKKYIYIIYHLMWQDFTDNLHRVSNLLRSSFLPNRSTLISNDT